jgi:hypothetical protein
MHKRLNFFIDTRADLPPDVVHKLPDVEDFIYGFVFESEQLSEKRRESGPRVIKIGRNHTLQLFFQHQLLTYRVFDFFFLTLNQVKVMLISFEKILMSKIDTFFVAADFVKVIHV